MPTRRLRGRGRIAVQYGHGVQPSGRPFDETPSSSGRRFGVLYTGMGSAVAYTNPTIHD